MASYHWHRFYGGTPSTRLSQCDAYKRELFKTFSLPKQHFIHQIVALEKLFRMMANTWHDQRKNVEQFLFMCMAHFLLTAVRECDAYNGELLKIFLLEKQHFKHQLVVLKELFRMISNLA